MSEPLAYFLTWTTRGTWVHGDERGSVDRSRNQVGHPIEDPHAFRQRLRERSMSDKPFVLASVMVRHEVDQAIRRVCVERDWRLHAINVRTNHVHVVVLAPGYSPEEVIRQLKSWSTRALRSNSHAGGDRPVWTRHGSTRYLWDADSVARAVRYVLEWQD
ncbi:MAG: transposase [Phycisphaerales bacterium JB060]